MYVIFCIIDFYFRDGHKRNMDKLENFIDQRIFIS